MQSEILLKINPVEAVLVTSDDEHQSEYVAAYDRRREYISGFSGSKGDAIITQERAVLWTDGRYHLQADDELNCDWLLMREGEKNIPTISEWLKKHLKPFSRVGADARLVPAYHWQLLEDELKEVNISLVEFKENPIDLIWKEHEKVKIDKSIFVLDIQYAGVSWIDKVAQVKQIIQDEGADAMVVTALDEIAWLLNIRGRDIPHNPFVSSYVILGDRAIYMYVEKSKLTPNVTEHLNINASSANAVFVYEYDKIWTELPTLAQNWKRIVLPTQCVFTKGVSQKVFSLIPEKKRLSMESPIIYLKAKKNQVEIENMKIAHIRDAAAMCMFFSYFEKKVESGHKWTEIEMSEELNHFRFEQINSLGNSFATTVGYGSNGAKPHYEPTFSTNVEIGDDSTIVIDSGGQYYEGTTDITRTVHLGKPRPEQINAYTRVLMGLIQFSTLTFPSDMGASLADIMARAPLWDAGLDYYHGTSHGIGSFLGVHESPIGIHYAHLSSDSKLEPGYFFSVEPGYYSESYFGIRLENILEVVNKPWLKHMSGQNFLGFVDVTLVPFEPKLINRTLLSSYHIRWLNDYNSKIREHVGKELKKQGEVEAFYWMMKRTEHIPGSAKGTSYQISTIIGGLILQILVIIL
ncbi:Peptidase [Oryctes borbonicus]|uniref:Peptidase n=1 Tax=Oryctes borbonicus TaxID=1629725 RepID=A0A0T6AZB6_9SCAR|nr:Peptidase [Oryctes borbonicus]